MTGPCVSGLKHTVGCTDSLRRTIAQILDMSPSKIAERYGALGTFDANFIACHKASGDSFDYGWLAKPFIGPENHGSQFEKQKTAFEDGGATDIVDEEKVPGSTETINEKP
ncbi:hypothetical protein BGW80DRAFT_1458988 [Lactifluus volemus]|nr:hypothetical protein BGW80DRAFT_1458988 [Lactifluus volemus]